MNVLVPLISLVNAAMGQTSDASADPLVGETAFKELRDAYVAQYQPLIIQSETAWWDANTTGSDAAFDRRKQAQNALVELHSDHKVFSKLKAMKRPGESRTPS